MRKKSKGSTILEVFAKCSYNEMKFEWDENKNKTNFEKHGLNFVDAELVFSSKAIHFLDGRFDYGEERLITLGTLLERVVVIVHTEREGIIRVISMRKANEREKEIYFKRFKENR